MPRYFQVALRLMFMKINQLTTKKKQKNSNKKKIFGINNLKIEKMICENIKEQDFKSRKEYLVALAIEYIRSHSGYVGIDDSIFFDEAECDGYALSEDLANEFELYDYIDF